MTDLSTTRRGFSAGLRGSRRTWIASALGAVGGAGVIGGMWLPLATLGGLGSVGFFDYNQMRVYTCIAAAAAAVVFSIVRCFRIALLAAGVLCGLLAATGIDLVQALREVTSVEGGDLAQMAHQMIAHSALSVGACLVPLCAAVCVAGGILGSAPMRVPTATSGS